MTRFVRIRPAEPQVHSDRGWRLRVERSLDELTTIVEEQTLPEQVENPNANYTKVAHQLMCTEADVRWLHAMLGELIETLDKADAPHAFAGYEADCEACGEGRQHYLHTDRVSDARWDEGDAEA